MLPSNVGYVVYVDEAGDPGVKQKTASAIAHASEWFVISAMVVSLARDRDVPMWAEDMRDAVRKPSLERLHYRNLSAPNQLRIARMLARKDLRLFTIASHKTNIRGYQNARMGGSFGRGEFYNWCLRLLLERVSDWCARRSLKQSEELEVAKIVFSERGGHDYDHLYGYLDTLAMQAENRTTFIKTKEIVPGVLQTRHCSVMPDHKIAGLQLADIAASAFFQAADSLLPKHSLAAASELKARTAIGPKQRVAAEYGLLRLPFRHQGEIPEADRPLFEMFGYSWD
ncbi:MAG: DUF3800 domain-containing protein [Sphingomonadaceae bacterium]|nr:DUF3800 domain-containing protein [Sphingomonadaceae bacterium]